MTDKLVAELRELLAKATPGEWHAGSREHMIGSDPTHLIAYDPAWGTLNNGRASPGIIATGNPNDVASSTANIALIVAMKGSLPALLDTLTPKESALIKPPREYEVSGDAVGGGEDTGCPPHCCCCGPGEPCCDCGEIMPSKTCIGEKCWCGEPAVKKVGEEIAFDDPAPQRHNLTSYICARHYAQLMGPAGAEQVGFVGPRTPVVEGIPAGMVADTGVIQADRDAAADIWRDYVARVGEVIAEKQMRGGDLDDGLPTLLARHRLAYTPKARPTASDGEARERIARIVSPTAAQLRDELAKPGASDFPEYAAAKAMADAQWDAALAKADAILAALPPTDGAGEQL